ncbi:MAG: P-loop NTPase [Candidatus Bathyarchaeia archaeon]
MKKAVAVCAVKGGVGKTLVALNLAKRLTKEGRTALVDADLDNSSFSQFTGIEGVIKIDSKQRFEPYAWEGMEVFSMSLVTSRDQSVSMTGDRYVQIIDDVVNRSLWDAEFYVFDMPGGSSDIFRAIMEIAGDHLVGDIIVSQPAMVDSTRKILNLHEYFEIPVLGVIENMSYLKVGAVTYYPFGRSTVEELAKEFGVRVLGEIPLDPKIAEGVQNGNPFLPEELMEPIENAVRAVVETGIKRPGFLEKIVHKVTDALKGEVEKVLASVIVSTNKIYDLKVMRHDTGFTDNKPFLIVITDESGLKEITRVGLRVTEDAVKVISEPRGNAEYQKWVEQFDFQIVSDFQTLSRIIMGKSVRRGREAPFSTWDAWCNGDLKAYGLGYAPRAVNAIRSIFENEEVMEPIRDKFGVLLGRWI